jgi:hypothetical protein
MRAVISKRYTKRELRILALIAKAEASKNYRGVK